MTFFMMVLAGNPVGLGRFISAALWPDESVQDTVVSVMELFLTEEVPLCASRVWHDSSVIFPPMFNGLSRIAGAWKNRGEQVG